MSKSHRVIENKISTVSRLALCALVPLLSVASVGCSGQDIDEGSLGVQNEALTASFVGSPTNHAATDVSVVSRTTDDFDEFSVDSTGLTYHHYVNGGLSSTRSLGMPPGVTSTPRVAACVTRVSTGGKRLDVFVTASDNKIYHRFQTNPSSSSPTFSGWLTILNDPTVDPNGKIAAASWGPGRIDLFWWTPSSLGHLGHAWADAEAWSGTESGDTASKVYLQSSRNPVLKTSLAVAAKGVEKLDLYFVGTHLHHHWYDSAAGNWGTGASLHREDGFVFLNNVQTGFNQSPGYVVATATGGAVDVVTRLFGTDLYRTDPVRFNNTFSGTKLNMGNKQASIVTAVTLQSSPFRLDVWGAKDGKDWQAFFPQ